MVVNGFLQQGKAHIKNNTPCQDSVSVHQGSFTTMVCVSDGAGSKAYSHLGSDTITANLTNAIEEKFDAWHNQIIQGTFEESFEVYVQEVLQAKVKELNHSAKLDKEIVLSDLACTLVMYAEKEDRAFLVHVGDGRILGLRSDYWFETLSFPENAEFANVTYFLTQPHLQKHIRAKVLNPKDYHAVLCMTDGGDDIFYVSSKSMVIAGLYYVLVDAIENNAKFIEKFQSFLANDTPVTVSDDIGIALLIRDEKMDMEAYQRILHQLKEQGCLKTIESLNKNQLRNSEAIEFQHSDNPERTVEVKVSEEVSNASSINEDTSPSEKPNEN